jgi:hypothetical protein
MADRRQLTKAHSAEIKRLFAIARLSPLVYEHINVLGRYAFSLPEAVSRGELRPLRNSSEVYEEIA